MIELLKEKLKLIWIVFRYYPNKTGLLKSTSCEYCGNSFMLVIEDTEVHEERDGMKIFNISYQCAKCGAVGTVVQAWSKNNEKI